jgi:hypothetical protein
MQVAVVVLPRPAYLHLLRCAAFRLPFLKCIELTVCDCHHVHGVSWPVLPHCAGLVASQLGDIHDQFLTLEDGSVVSVSQFVFLT